MSYIFTYHYNQNRDIIQIPGMLWGPNGKQKLRLVFDTGAFRTIINTRITDTLGYQAGGVHERVTTSTAISFEEGYTLTVVKLAILEFPFENIEICCFDVPEYAEIDGLIGLDLLEKFEVRLKHREHKIQFRPLS